MNTGTIQSITPKGSYNGKFGEVFKFDMTIQTPEGMITGEIGSKSPAYPKAVGETITVNSTNTQYGVRLKAVKENGQPMAQSSGGGGQGSPQGKPDWDKIAEGKVKCNVVCAYLSAGKEPTRENCNAWTDFIMGKQEAQPAPQPAPQLQPQTTQVMQDAGFVSTDEEIPF